MREFKPSEQHELVQRQTCSNTLLNQSPLNAPPPKAATSSRRSASFAVAPSWQTPPDPCRVYSLHILQMFTSRRSGHLAFS